MRIIAGRWGGRRLAAPPGRSTRPTADRVREAWMSALQPEITGATVLDLFAGSGALGLEALSRGAERVTFVERARAALRALEQNVETLEAGEACQVVRADAVAWIRQLPPGAFDLALADPPYAQGLAAILVERFAAVPFARWLWVEHGAHETLPPLPGSRTRRYGDTGLTSIPALQGSES
ncbi:MAG: 16S rRNA (guanine(966)-N(2))-methyltransferase RsmD [Gemmatimonadota bacterium]